MVKFSWKYTTYESGNTYITWKATWDGRWDNDDLIHPKDNWGDNYEHLDHPFSRTADYEQSKSMYEYFSKMTFEDKKRDVTFTVLEDDGTEREVNWGNNEDVNPEDYNPENIRETGDTVAANSVTRALCEILSDNRKIKASSGNTHSIGYRARLLGCLSDLWD